MKKHFYLFRHGQSVWNAEGRPHGQHPYPVPLTITGQEQAKELARLLSDKKIEIILTSDLLRAEQTANIIGDILKIGVIKDMRFREVDYGLLNGKYTFEREEIFPGFRKCYADYALAFPEGECLNEVAERMNQGMKEYAENFEYQNIAISSHRRSIEVLIEKLFDYPCSALGNCSYAHIVYDTDSHLYEGIELPKKREY